MRVTALDPVRPLPRGSRVALVAPSGPLKDAGDVATGEATVRSFGWEPVIGEHVLDRYSYFAAPDDARVADFNAALRDDSVDAIWCLRGGYGAMRILDRIDWSALRQRPRAVMGYSDISAIHAAIGRECGLISYHSPVARAELSPFSRDSFVRAVVTRDNSCGYAPGARVIAGGRARGRLVGGNLSLLSSIAGSRYFPDMRDAILVLEDINERLYRIDRMLTQLMLTGSMRGIAGLAFGQCTGCDADESRDDARLDRSLDDVLCEWATALGIPCITGIPLGHISDQWTIPLGATATLDADALTLNVEQ